MSIKPVPAKDASEPVFNRKGYKCALHDVPAQDITYHNLPVIRFFISKRGRIISVRVTNVSAYKQRLLREAIFNARFLGLIPYLKKPVIAN